MFVQYSAAVKSSPSSENAFSNPSQISQAQAFKEAITLFCKRSQPSLSPEALAWFTSAASDALGYLKEQLRILEALDSKGVLQLYTDQIPSTLRLHGGALVSSLESLLGAGGLNIFSVSIVDTRIAIKVTLPQDPASVGKRLGCEIGFDWNLKAEPCVKVKDGFNKPSKPKSDREEVRNRGCLDQLALSFEQRLVSWTGDCV